MDDRPELFHGARSWCLALVDLDTLGYVTISMEISMWRQLPIGGMTSAD